MNKVKRAWGRVASGALMSVLLFGIGCNSPVAEIRRDIRAIRGDGPNETLSDLSEVSRKLDETNTALGRLAGTADDGNSRSISDLALRLSSIQAELERLHKRLDELRTVIEQSAQQMLREMADGKWRFVIEYEADWHNGAKWKSIYEALLSHPKLKVVVGSQMRSFYIDKKYHDEGEESFDAFKTWVSSETITSQDTRKLNRFREFISGLKAEGVMTVKSKPGGKNGELSISGDGKYTDIYPGKDGIYELEQAQARFPITLQGHVRPVSMQYLVTGLAERFIITMEGYDEPFLLAARIGAGDAPFVLSGDIYAAGYLMGSFRAFRFAGRSED